MTDTTDPTALEVELREVTGYQRPLKAFQTARQTGSPPRSVAVIRKPVPLHECQSPVGTVLYPQLRDHSLPEGTTVIGPVKRRADLPARLDNDVGWVEAARFDGTLESVPVITGEYYDGSPRFVIIAERTVLQSESAIDEAIRDVSGGPR